MQNPSNHETSIRVMVVEDDAIQAEVCKLILEDAGYDVRCFEDGQEALDALREEPVDVILADHDMPEMTGLTFLRRAALVAPQAARLMLTASDQFDVAVAAINQSRVFRFLTKPVDARQLQLLVRLAHEHQTTQSLLAATRVEAMDRDVLLSRLESKLAG